jgi:hypothetical protein
MVWKGGSPDALSVGAVFAVFAEPDEVVGTHDSSDVLEFAVGACGAGGSVG